MTAIQRTFAGGEIAPTLHGRVDTVKFQTGLKTCRNFQVMRHGGAQNRPGTKFVAETKDSTKAARLIPFIFNSSQTYILEFGDLYIRVIEDGAYVLETAVVISTVSTALIAIVVTTTPHGYSTGDEVSLTGVSGMTEVNGRNFKIVAMSATQFSLQNMDGTNFDSTGLMAGTGGTVARVYTVTSPYVEADLFDINFVQAADVMVFVHRNYAPRKLTRSALTSWTLAAVTFGPEVQPPTSVACSGGGTSKFVVSSIDPVTFEESVGSVASAAGGGTISWVPPTSGAVPTQYAVYKETPAGSSVYGFCGTSNTLSFLTSSSTAVDPLDNPIEARSPFSADGVSQPSDGSGYNPAAAAYYQSRLVFGYTDANPQGVWTSKSGAYFNFTVNEPVQDDDPVTFTLASQRQNSIRHLLNLGKLIVFTSGGEWTANGDDASALTPTAINARQQSYNGSDFRAPLTVDTTAIYLQARGGMVRDLAFNIEADGYRGNDLSIFAAHLFRGKTIVDWTYQQYPDSIIWAVRSDGELLGLTYVRGHQVWGWHHHDTDGTFESVCSVPEGVEDALYAVVARTIGGTTKRYIERFTTRNPTDALDYVFMDSALSFDGRNSGATTMTVSGGTTWDYLETLTITSSVATFTADDVGKQIVVTDEDGVIIRLTINAFTSTTVVTGKPDKTVPATLQAVATTDWALAVKEVFGLWHLEGKDVSAYGDGFVEASPNNNPTNDATLVKTVTSGSISFGTTVAPKWYSYIHVGLPYLSDLETLDMDAAGSDTITDKRLMVNKVIFRVENTKGLFTGPKAPDDDSDDPLQRLYEAKYRELEGLDDPVSLLTGLVDVTIQGEYSKGGRVFVRQVDPVPASILTVAASGVILRG